MLNGEIPNPLEMGEVSEASTLDEKSVKPCIQDRFRSFSDSKIGIILPSFLLIFFISIVLFIPDLRPLIDLTSLREFLRPDVLATFLGLFTGFTLDRLIEFRQERGTINKIIISIITELELNIIDLEEWKFRATQIYFTRSQNACFESAIGGGYLSLMDVETQKKLSRLYSNLNFITYKSDRILMMGSDMRENNPEYIVEANKKMRCDVKESITEHQEVIRYLRERVRH